MNAKLSKIKSGYAISILIFVLISAVTALAGEALEVIEHESGFYYTVKKGDTLWDLSQRFSDSPWQWPDLWKENSEIANPHWIYPGQKIRLYRKEGIEKHLQEEAAGVDTGMQPAPEEPPYYIFSEINKAGFIKEAAITPEGRIFKVYGDSKLISEGDLVYITPSDSQKRLPIGETYTIYKTIQPIRAPYTKKYIGVEHYIVGVLKIEAEEQGFYLGEILRSYESIGVGDLLMPLLQRSPKIEIKESAPDIDATVIITEEQTWISANDFVSFIDRGSNDGVEVGQVYAVYYPETAQIDPKVERQVALPPFDIGSILVVHTEPTTATVLITWAEKSIFPGARVRSWTH